MSQLSKLLFIAGPTAVGKSQIALGLARHLNGEIISCDAMQVYRELAIASNKPTSAEQLSVAHHLVDVVSVTEDFDVVRFHDLALAAINDILARGKMPLVVGGSGMYMEILLDGIFAGPGADAEIREALMVRAEKEGPESLLKELQTKDPEAALKTHPNDLRRMVRALEVVLITGRPVSELRKEREGILEKYNIRAFVLNRPREELYERINERVEEMFKQGLVDEIRRFKSLRLGKTAASAIGVKEIFAFLDDVGSDRDRSLLLDEMKELIKKNTRNYAKRQLTWFRKDPRFEWIEIGSGDTIDGVIERIINHGKGNEARFG